MKVIRIYILTVFVLLNGIGQLFGQVGQKVDHTKVLKVGDDFVPPNTIKIMRGPFNTIDWASLQDKVIVLDFFDTFCTACIEAMPHLQQLQDKLGSKLLIINVGWQDRSTLTRFFDKNEFLKRNKVNLPVIYADDYLGTLFPHVGKPHVVLLFRGKVQAITFSSAINEKNILTLFKTGSITLPLKDDFAVDRGGIQDLNSQSNIVAGSWITGYQNGIPTQGLQFDTDSVTGKFRSSMYNRSIFRALLNTWSRIQRPDFLVNENRVKWIVKDPGRYDDILNIGEEWLGKYGVCYQRIASKKYPDSVVAKMILNDFHHNLGIKSYWGKEKKECLILKRLENSNGNHSPKSGDIKYEGTAVLAAMMDYQNNYPPVLDHVKSDQILSLSKFDTIKELNEQLNGYGMEIVYGNEELDVFVIEEIN